MGRDFRFSIDRGGTFTDVTCSIAAPDGSSRYRVLKLLSEDPANYRDAPTEGIRRILEEETGVPHSRTAPLDTSRIAEIRMGTTVATNALLERKGARTVLALTQGFRDLLHIGNQSRPRIFDLEIRCPEVLYEDVVEIDELVSLPIGPDPNPRNGAHAAAEPRLPGDYRTGPTGEEVVVRRPPDLAAARAALQRAFDAGTRSVAVLLKHAAVFPDHELAVGALCREIGFAQVSLSHQVMPMVKMVPRGYTACADAYLTPKILTYIQTFQSGFDEGISKLPVSFMQSDGGLTDTRTFSGHRAILSGPAGGVVGYAVTTAWERSGPLQVIGFDMGGTSTDVSRFAGRYDHVFEATISGVTIQAPQLDVNTVAAGGGSRLFFRNGLFVVGPESAGAHPGPVCYRKGGHLAVTDANLMLGRIVPEFFPSIFGPTEKEPLDSEATRRAFEALTGEVNAFAAEQAKRAGGKAAAAKTPDDVAYGFLQVANEAMCRPIREITLMKGYDVVDHVLACFGGAGGQHACAIARSLGMRTVFVHRYASVLSAVGIGIADSVAEAQEPCALRYTPEASGAIAARFSALEAAVRAKLSAQGFPAASVACERFLNLRFEGTDVAMMIPKPDDGDFGAAFVARYRREFGFTLDRPLAVDDVRVRGSAGGGALPADPAAAGAAPPPLPEPAAVRSVFFLQGGRQPTPVHRLGSLSPGHSVAGPALLVDSISTVVVEPGCTAHVTERGDLRIDVGAGGGSHKVTEELDPIQLAIFSHRFMGIAEQMGRTLQRTSVSVNIKERLDFSCALFDPDGGLVANAPHLPVHLGAMQEAVRFQVRHWAANGGLQEGDVLVSNHPQLAGGSHLPDITVMTPVFEGGRVVFFVASRGHHADIGGITPGSMPPRSTSLLEEGAVIVAHKLVRDGAFDEAGITALLEAPASFGIPGVTGTRNLQDNLSDLKAQVAANQRGIALVHELIREYGLSVVQAYMRHICENAELAVREMLREFSLARGLPEVGTVRAEDFLDDGSRIALAVTVDRRDGSALFDFEGTGPEIHGNLNAPPAVTYSAIIFSLRCLVQRDIPLNQGCLAPVTIRIPDNTLLKPSAAAAVVGGNVLTSQRVTDVVLRAFEACAASQGCMNNFTFGDARLGYYETVAGGAGAGPSWHGRSGVHTHMTNTRITDPEILERRFPVALLEFSLREGSGGAGRFRGGDGVVRDVEFLRPLTVGILSERRALRPYGLRGGEPGARGLNLWVRADGRTVNLGGKATVEMGRLDRFRLLTPGGGGFGAPNAAGGGEDSLDVKGAKKGGDKSGGGMGEMVREMSGSLADFKQAQLTV